VSRLDVRQKRTNRNEDSGGQFEISLPVRHGSTSRLLIHRSSDRATVVVDRNRILQRQEKRRHEADLDRVRISACWSLIAVPREASTLQTGVLFDIRTEGSR